MTISTNWVDELKPAEPNGADTITAERARSNIDVELLSEHLLGREFLERQARILPLLENQKLFSKEQVSNLSRPDRYFLGLARGKKIRQMKDKYMWDDEDHEMAKYLIDDVSPYQLQVTMFRQTLLEQTSEEQKRIWLPRQEKWEIIGAYAQTELGHGSNVQGIETTAHWDQHTKEFIIHSPTLTASKWWNGTLGRTANFAVVVAQLILPNSSGPLHSYGPHTFIVQIRDLKTHQTLDGIVCGDINAKYGYATMDNAYCLFNQVRIPHNQMLARYSYVDPETGKYREPENRAVVYGSLTHARKRITMAARLALARAVTVAVRYCSVRRQFRDKSSPEAHTEIAVLDYPNVQIRLLPLLATSFALHYTGEQMGKIYDRTRSNIDKGDLSTLIDLHSLSSGLKSLSSEYAAAGIETCRRAMGGHGYGGGSGLVGLNADYLSKPTVEGDNWMITQQMARYLIKKVKLVSAPKFMNSANRTERQLLLYHRGHSKPQGQVLFNDRALATAFEHRASFLAFKAYHAVEIDKKSWTSQQIQLHHLSIAQSQAILVYNFFDSLSADSHLPSNTKSILWLLYRLFALYTIDNNSRDFAVSGSLSDDELEQIPEKILEIMQQIRPHAVRLADSWSFPDYLLNSALGRYDGRIYEDLFNRAHRLNPLNNFTFNPDYRTDEIVMGSGDAGKILAKL